MTNTDLKRWLESAYAAGRKCERMYPMDGCIDEDDFDSWFESHKELIGNCNKTMTSQEFLDAVVADIKKELGWVNFIGSVRKTMKDILPIIIKHAKALNA